MALQPLPLSFYDQILSGCVCLFRVCFLCVCLCISSFLIRPQVKLGQIPRYQLHSARRCPLSGVPLHLFLGWAQQARGASCCIVPVFWEGDLRGTEEPWSYIVPRMICVVPRPMELHPLVGAGKPIRWQDPEISHRPCYERGTENEQKWPQKNKKRFEGPPYSSRTSC